ASRSVLSARLMLQRERGRLASASRPLSRMPGPSKLLVAVAPERRARRGHRSCVCSHRERRDRDQRERRERGDEFPHDTSPCCEALCCFLRQQHGGSPWLAVIAEIGLRE